MKEAIKEEVELTLADEIKQSKYEIGDLLAMIYIFHLIWVGTNVLVKTYDSLSGHALAIGCLSNKILNAVVSSEMCRQCSIATENGEEPPEH